MGEIGIFSLFTKDEHGNWVCYEGEMFTVIEIFQRDVQKVVVLVCTAAY